MNTLNYQYFLAIAEHGTISRAAEALYVSQPYLSKVLIRMENELGIKLFDRSSSPLTPTEAGLLFTEYCRELQDLEIKFQSKLQTIKNPQMERLIIGAPPIRGSFWLPIVIPAFSKLHPFTEIVIRELRSSQIPQKIAEGQIDLGVFTWPAEQKNLTYEKLMDERVLLMLPCDHPLAYDQKQEPDQAYRTLTESQFSLLEGQKFISYDTPNGVTNRTLRYLEDCGVHCHVSITTKNNATTYHLCERGMGLAIIMEATRSAMAFQNHPCFYQLGDPPLAESWYSAHRNDAALTPAASSFLELVRKYVPGILAVQNAFA